MDQVIHAEKVTQNKKKNGEKKADVFVADSCDAYGGGDADVFYMEGPSWDNRRGRGRGRGRGFSRGRGRGRGRGKLSDIECWSCGMPGHFSRKCPEKGKPQRLDREQPSAENGEEKPQVVDEMLDLADICTIADSMPQITLLVHERPYVFLCDSGACRTVMRDDCHKFPTSKDSILVRSSGGEVQKKINQNKVGGSLPGLPL